jgi:hypothetical protein
MRDPHSRKKRIAAGNNMPATRRSNEPGKTSPFEAACEWELTGRLTAKKVVVRLGRPQFDGTTGRWICPSEICGLRRGGVRLARGGNPFEALLGAMDRFRRCFRAEREIYESTLDSLEAIMGSPYFMFPEYVPTEYGADVHRRITELAEREIRKVERQWSRRRLGDQRYREIAKLAPRKSSRRINKT